jgi:microcystin degradation protein MlrC
MSPRLFAGGVATETNVFSPMPTGLRDFEVAGPQDPPEVRDRPLGGSTFRRYAAVSARRGWSYVQGTYAFALPSGLTTRSAYETLRDRLLSEIEAALPLDAVILHLHGAMVADGYGECETDTTARVRALVGDRAKIGVLLDPHCDLPQALVEAADAIVIYKEYPHTDIEDRGEELVTLIVRAADGEIEPEMAVFDCRMIGNYPTWRQPMRSFVDVMMAVEEEPAVLSVSLAHCFPWGDSVEMGARALAVTDADAKLASSVAEELGRRFYRLRSEVDLQPRPMDQALDLALAAAPASAPVVVADVADNAGGGAPSDSTFALRELLERKVRNAALAMIWDPVAVDQAFAAGEGATLKLRLGGKMGPHSGDPLDVTATVAALAPALVQRWPQTDGYLDVAVGECARLAVEGIDVIVSSTRHQVLGLEVFTGLGIDPGDRDLLVVKSANHFHAAFGPIAGEVLYMSTPGALSFDYPSVPYTLLDKRKYPWVDDPWSDDRRGEEHTGDAGDTE